MPSPGVRRDLVLRGGKEKNVTTEAQCDAHHSSVWRWLAICAETKLVPCWHVGARTAYAALAFMENLAGRLCHRVQLTTDGHNPYLEAIDGAFKNDIDYARLLKIHESPKRGRLLTSVKTQVRGNPDPALISTSYVERQNLTMRMGMRSFTRKTNAFSKKFENHCHAISLHFIYYNFCRVHQTLKTIPAMAAGINDHVWSVTELCMLAARG